MCATDESSVTEAAGATCTGLSPDRQELVESYMGMAQKLMQTHLKQWPWARDDLQSAAYMALVEAAATFDPARGVKFATFARWRIIGAMRDVGRNWVRAQSAAGRLREELECGNLRGHFVDGHGLVLGIEPHPEVGSELERAELIERWARRLPPIYAAAFREIYIRGKTQLEAGRVLGLSQARMSTILRAATAMLLENARGRHSEAA
jgi:RNA polymerase sigma factor (sigma-70 family)